MNEDLQDYVSLAMRKAWQLGQTYWAQADSEYESQWRKSNVTEQKYLDLVDEVREYVAKQGETK